MRARIAVQVAILSTDGGVSPATSPAPEATQEIFPTGPTSDEARARLQKDGLNAMPDSSAHPLRNAFAKFWAPVPWLIEVPIVLEIVLNKD